MPVVYDDEKVIRPGVQHNWTKEMLQEYVKCAKSVKYFALNHCKVFNVKGGLINLQFREYQMKMFDLLEKEQRTCMVLPRQVGKTLILSIYILWLATFSENPQNIFILAHKGEMARSILSNIKVMYEEITPYLKKGIKEYAKTTIRFEDDTQIKTSATTSDSIRGQAISFLLLDEFAFVPDHIADDFYTAAQPTLATGGKMCIISTPNGAKGLFYEIYDGAKKRENGFAAYTIPWNAVPGRDEAFKKQTIAEVGLVKWSQEYACVFQKTLINIRDTTTGIVESLTIGDLHELLKRKNFV